MNLLLNCWIIPNKSSFSRKHSYYPAHLTNNQTDIDNWIAFKAGDAQAFDRLFRDFHPILVQYGTKICPDREMLEDAIQDLFVEIWQSPSQTQVASVKAYFFKALKYKLFRVMKAGNHRIGTLDDETYFEMPAEHFLITREEERSRAQKIQQAVAQLPSRQKEIVYLRIFQGLDYDAISDVMGINYQVARNLFYQSIKSLRSEISDW